MKLVIFRAGKDNKKNRNGNKNARYNAERIMFFSFVCIFAALILVQAAMVNPSIRTFLVDESGLEGRPLEQQEYLYGEGEISISLCSEESNEDLKVLVNGNETAVFSTNVINLKVKDGDVIEIDSNMVEDAEVEIVSASKNITGNNIGKKVKLNSGVQELTTITIESIE